MMRKRDKCINETYNELEPPEIRGEKTKRVKTDRRVHGTVRKCAAGFPEKFNVFEMVSHCSV